MTVLKKMSTTLSEPIEYCAEWAPDNSVNKLIGKKFEIQFTDEK